jgi:opacity protein-like surface antigen
MIIKMKKSLFIVAFALVATASFAQEKDMSTTVSKNEVNVDVAVFSWDASTFDFGKIKQGVPVSHEFKFTNTGKAPLVIVNAQPSCGCTTPDWTKAPVPPGGSGFIKATFNAAAAGPFNKTITVTANTQEGTTSLVIKGEVVVAE